MDAAGRGRTGSCTSSFEAQAGSVGEPADAWLQKRRRGARLSRAAAPSPTAIVTLDRAEPAAKGASMPSPPRTAPQRVTMYPMSSTQNSVLSRVGSKRFVLPEQLPDLRITERNLGLLAYIAKYRLISSDDLALLDGG